MFQAASASGDQANRGSAVSSADAAKIRVMSWNLDGLDNVSLNTRITGAISEILKSNPDVVFLQEIVPKSYDVIQEKMGAAFQLFPAGATDYFTVMLLNKKTVWVDRKEVKPFYTSLMLRKLQIADVNIKGIDFRLMTSHLESTRDHARERKRQLDMCFSEMQRADSKYNVIFGGDLNLGSADDKTLVLPSGVSDLWEMTGFRNEAKFTWDMKHNDNKRMNGTPRCRFDRMYFKKASGTKVKPEYFELVGLERVRGSSRFASDHWGILSHFRIQD